ncbi:MAG: hypothetical protein N4A53_06605 [Pelagimonas sp.]|jgi:hypothetical protein|nr:hypothetical protein [Pelagimonas sp.]
MTTPGKEFQTYALAVGRVAGELRGLQDRLVRLESTLETLYERADVELDAHSIGTLQDVDFLNQSISALSDYLDHLSGTASTDLGICVRDAVDAIPLRDMASRLRGRAAGAPPSGEAELF